MTIGGGGRLGASVGQAFGSGHDPRQRQMLNPLSHQAPFESNFERSSAVGQVLSVLYAPEKSFMK